MSKLETVGWQIPQRSGWTLYVGLLPSEETGEEIPWLYLHRVGVPGRLTLARFKDEERARTTQTFINAMFDQITTAILIAQMEYMDENKHTAGEELGPADESRRSSERGISDDLEDPAMDPEDTQHGRDRVP